MNVASRPVTAGKTRTCPHCKATILESLSICPGCLHHLRFDQEAAKRQVAATSALRVEGVIRHPPLEDPWEYYVVIAIRNDRGEEVTGRLRAEEHACRPCERRQTLAWRLVGLTTPATHPDAAGAPAASDSGTLLFPGRAAAETARTMAAMKTTV
ncbi:MAG: hypothetical protein E6K51_10255 [Gammaproteobacteria bacterium]|nr:MAG: hypothetical protein E6K51_10255 [Gammaproteobacteria bacterium]